MLVSGISPFSALLSKAFSSESYYEQNVSKLWVFRGNILGQDTSELKHSTGESKERQNNNVKGQLDMTEILLKIALNTIKSSEKMLNLEVDPNDRICCCFHCYCPCYCSSGGGGGGCGGSCSVCLFVWGFTPYQ